MSRNEQQGNQHQSSQQPRHHAPSGGGVFAFVAVGLVKLGKK